MTQHQRNIIDYYNQTYSAYRWVWGLDQHLGMHLGYFDAAHRRHHDAVVNMNRALAELADIRSHHRVLDAGCGVGGSAIWLASKIGCEAVGLNINANQIEIARQHAFRKTVDSKVDFIVGDYCNSGFDDESFDIVWALDSMCHAENKADFLKEAARLLKPDGRILVADGFLAKKRFSANESMILKKWQDGWFVPSVLNVVDFRDLLGKCGFDPIRFRDITVNIAPSSFRVYRNSVLLFPVGLLLFWLRFRTRVQTRSIISGYYQYRARQQGLGLYGVFCAEKSVKDI